MTRAPSGAAVLKIAVTAPPEGGKANAALIKLLAKALGRPKSAIEIASGAQSRTKSLRLGPDTPELRTAVSGLLDQASV